MLKDKLKEKLKNEGEGNNKKKIENLVIFVIILIVTIIIINSIWTKDESNVEKNNTVDDRKLASSVQSVSSNLDPLEQTGNLEEKLASILTSIEGVGKVKVFINYSESSSVEAMYNETTKESSTEETDTSGGVRTIEETDTQKDVIFSEDSGNKTPVTKKVTNPTIEGAIITASGAKDTQIKANIVDAVSAATGLATHKVQVFEMKE